jgi:hypothetical protein
MVSRHVFSVPGKQVALSLLRLAAIHGEERCLALARARTSGTLERLR